MDRVTNVLVASDFSPASRTAIAHAARLAESAAAKLHVVHVVDAEPDGGSGPPEGAQAALSEEVEAAAPGVQPASLRVVVGRPVREILAAADEVGADVICIGVNGQSGHVGIGTVAVRVVRKSKVRVLLVPASCKPVYRCVVACVDCSELSVPVIEQACRSASPDGEVFALHVFQPEWERAQWMGQPADSFAAEQAFREKLTPRVESVVAQAEQGVHTGRIHVELVHAPDMARGICEYAASHDADLIVLGTTGRSGLAYMLLGTTAEKVLRDAQRPVLAVRA